MLGHFVSLFAQLVTLQVLLLMRNLSINLSSPDFEEHVNVQPFEFPVVFVACVRETV